MNPKVFLVAGLLLLTSLAAHADTVKKAALPLTLYSDSGHPEPFIPAGYMGNTAAIKMNERCTDSPHSGKTCLKVSYTAKDQWGGVVWQNPPNNWGMEPGGLNLSGAKKLTFWARGSKGGEVVSFGFGLIDHSKPYHDTGKGNLDRVVLTTTWKRYLIPLAGQNMSRIVTGFVWTLSAAGSPETFYLDDIRYQ